MTSMALKELTTLSYDWPVTRVIVRLDACTVGGQVGSDNEQVGLVGLGVGTGELDLLAKVVALVAGCHDGDCALLDLHINLVALEGRQCIMLGQLGSAQHGWCTSVPWSSWWS